MNEILILVISLCLGLIIGGLFFGGLWWTARKTIESTNSALWLFGSLMVRMAIVITAFYFLLTTSLLGSRWQIILFCFIGFICARIIAIRFSRKTQAPPHTSYALENALIIANTQLIITAESQVKTLGDNSRCRTIGRKQSLTAKSQDHAP